MSGSPGHDVLGDALLAVTLLRRDPGGLGGIILRGSGPARDAVLAELGPMRRVPIDIDDDALLGGRDLAATLAGRPGVYRQGLLGGADGALLVVPMAERMRDDVGARLAAAMDMGEVVIERDALSARQPARFGLVLLDDGGDDEAVAERMSERVAFRFDLSDVASASTRAPLPIEGGPVATEGWTTIVAVADALGIASMRAMLMTSRVAAMLGGGGEALTTAARLVLAHRATRLPAADDAPPPPPTEGAQTSSESGPLEDQILAATLAALPPDVLAQIAAGQGRAAARSGGQGERRRSPTRGRPLGARAGLPRGGARLALIDTLRAAAPWQRLRGADGRIAIRREDLRIKRFETRAGATTVFAVDASGSAAASRLAEAKGAVELLLAEAYARRTEVALVAFRGAAAQILLPATRSLTRARRELAELPGGGGTPLASGLDLTRQLTDAARARGRTPFVVVLSDGRANVADTATSDPQVDAMRAARALGATRTGAVFIDIGARPRAEAAAIAGAMGARYLPLPRADAGQLHAAIRSAQ